MQVAVQPKHVRSQDDSHGAKYIDNTMPKTVNLPHKASIKDIKRIYWLAYKLKCKGIIVYRYGSKKEQVLYIGEYEREKRLQKFFVLNLSTLAVAQHHSDHGTNSNTF